MNRAALIYNESMSRYDFGPGHPFRGDRHVNFMKLFMEKVGLNNGFDIIEPTPASDDELQLVHAREYVDYIKKGCGDPWSGTTWGYLDLDTPLVPGMNEAARIIAGSALLAGELVATGRYDIAVSVGGGMHHARPYRGAGFCIFNDVALCIKHLQQRHGLKKILVIDTDGHAGDGTAEIFAGDPDVLCISLHQDPSTQYPGKGFADEIGLGRGKGFTVNVPLPARAAINPYVYALDEIFVPLAHQFRPEVIIRNGGSDPHFADHLVLLGLTVPGFYRIGRKIRETADEVCGGRVIDLPGSGYNTTVLPHAWLGLIAGVAGISLDLHDPIPFPPWLHDDCGMEEVARVVEHVKGHLAAYWHFS